MKNHVKLLIKLTVLIAIPAGMLSPPALAAEEITIICTGDIVPGSIAEPRHPFPRTKKYHPSPSLFREVSFILKRGDITIGNLEGPICHADNFIVDKGTGGYSFCSPPETAKYLAGAGFTVLNLANNHTFDCTGEGLYETYLHLYRNNILACGLWYTSWHIPELPFEAELTMPVVEVKGLRAAVLGFASRDVFKSINHIEESVEMIRRAKEVTDLVIVTFHGGAELDGSVSDEVEIYMNEKRGNTIAFARAAVNAGADLVFGHGPHVLRGMEMYRGKIIAYSLGNFCDMGLMKEIYPGEKSIAVSVILEVTLDEKGNYLRGRLHPVTTAGSGIPRIDPSGKGIRMINDLSRHLP